MNKTDLARFCVRLCALYNKPMYNAEELAAFEPLYAGYTYQEASRALNEYAESKRTVPRPAEIIAIMNEHRRELRHEQAEQERKNIRYDSNGQRLYKCPYCQDSGYMQVRIDGDWSTHKCVHTKQKAMTQLKQTGSFGFNLPKAGIHLRLKWELGGFVPVTTQLMDYKPELLSAEDMSAELAGQCDLPF